MDSCWLGCTLACSHAVDDFKLKTGPHAGEKVLVDGPEYENAAGLGSNIGVFDPNQILEMNFYCDTYGVDTISFATSVAFCMECFQEGILTKENTGGLELSWGNAESALELLHQMARGEGFGVIVGQGTRYMKSYFASEFGGDPGFLSDIAMEVKSTLARYEDLQDVIAILGQEELSERDQKTVIRARRLQRFLSQPFFSAEEFTGNPGKFVSLQETLRGFREILDGRHDAIPEQAFYMVGTIDDAMEKAREITEEAAG